MNTELHFKLVSPDKSLTDFVESFWFVHHQSDCKVERISIPDSKIDLLFSKSETELFHITLIGLETHSRQFQHVQNAFACGKL